MDPRTARGLLRELGHRLPAAARLAFLAGAEELAAPACAAHPDAQVEAARPGANLDLLVAGQLDPQALPSWLRALRPGGTLLACAEGEAPALRAALETAGFEVKRIGPASWSGYGLRERLGLGTRGTLTVRALRPPGTGQH